MIDRSQARTGQRGGRGGIPIPVLSSRQPLRTADDCEPSSVVRSSHLPHRSTSKHLYCKLTREPELELSGRVLAQHVQSNTVQSPGLTHPDSCTSFTHSFTHSFIHSSNEEVLNFCQVCVRGKTNINWASRLMLSRRELLTKESQTGLI